jgi:hypothetical protein
MAEYLVASPPRRTSIIREARFPKVSIVAHYDLARDGLTTFLTDNTRSLRHISETRERLARREARPDAGDWIVKDCRASTESLDLFVKAYNRLMLSGLACHPIHGKQAPLHVGPTKIQVNLDVRTVKPVMNGKDQVGGAILLFSRGETSSEKRIDRCKTIAGLIHMAVTSAFSSLGDPERGICLAVDVFAGKSYTPPGTFARKLRHIEDSCEEIADRWKRVGAPEDYDGPPYD